MSATQVLPCKTLTPTWTDAPRCQSHVARGGLVIADQAIVSLASFVTAAIVGRMCGREEMGIYGLAVSIFWLLAAIPNSLIWTPFTSRMATLTSRQQKSYLGSVTCHAVLVATLSALVLLILGLASLRTSEQFAWFAPMCLALASFVWMMILREHVRRINLAQLQTHELLLIDVPAALIQMLLLMGLGYLGLLSASTALLAVAAASFVALLWLLHNRKQLQFRASHAWYHWSENRRFGDWVLGVSFAWIVGDTSYRWMLGSISGMEALGEFTAAQSIVLAVNPFLLAMSNFARATAANSIARDGAADLRKNTIRATLLTGLFAGVSLATLALLGGPMVRLVFGPEFGGQGAVVATLCLGMFAHSLLVPSDAVLAALQRGRALLAASAARTMVIFAAGAPLIWWLGSEGVGYSIALGCAAATMVQWFALSRDSAFDSTANQQIVPLQQPEGAAR